MGRKDFFSRILFPKMEAERLQNYALRSGVHPHGIILNQPFYRFPFNVDTKKIKKELKKIVTFSKKSSRGWSAPHKEIATQHHHLTESTHGVGELRGPFISSEGLKNLNYTKKILSHFGSIIGNVGLMRLQPGLEVETHVDIHSYWDHRVRVHIPIKTNPKVQFACGLHQDRKVVNMPQGSCILFDNHESHWVKNNGQRTRVHLAVDTIGTRIFWAWLQGTPFQEEIKPLLFENWDDSKIEEGNFCENLDIFESIPERIQKLLVLFCEYESNFQDSFESLSLLGMFSACDKEGSIEDFYYLDSFSVYFVDKNQYPKIPAFMDGI